MEEINNPPWFSGSDDENENDDWFFESIRRYDELFMFTLQCTASSIDITPDGSKIILVGKTNDEKHEILIYSIPFKLLTDCPVKEGLLGKRDFSLVAGGSSKKPFLQVKFYKNKALTLQKNALALWTPKLDSDLLEMSETIELSKGQSFLIVGSKCFVAVSQEETSEILHIDLETFKVHQKLSYAYIIDKFSVTKGDQIIHTDVNGNVFRGSTKIRDGQPGKAFSSFISCDGMTTLICDNDALNIFDVETGKLKTIDVEGVSRPLTASIRGDLLAITLKNNNVMVLHRDFGELFIHDGHKYPVLAHAWHPVVPRLVFSSDAKRNLHAWKYKAKK